MVLSRNGQFWLLHLGGWCAWMVLWMVITALYEDAKGPSLLFYPIVAGAGIVLTYPLRSLYGGLWDHALFVRVPSVLGAALLVAFIWASFQYEIRFYYFAEVHGEARQFVPFLKNQLGYTFFLIMGWSCLYFGIKYYQLLQEETQKTLQSEALGRIAQLRMLRYQLNPHFLFNTLNAISTLILSADNDAANSLVARLSDFLRYCLDKDPLGKVPLAEEIEILRLYLGIEQIRFEDRLKVEIDVSENATRALVPSLLLQPLVENSIRYAVSTQEAGAVISISATAAEGWLILKLSDNGPGIEMDGGSLPDSDGLGIKNVRNRLDQLYGKRQTCSFSNGSGGGLTIHIEIPLEMAA